MGHAGESRMTTEDLRRHLAEAGIVPILMGGEDDVGTTMRVADALVEAGATLIEILVRRSDAPVALAEIRRRHPRVLLAAGTVLDVAGAARAEAAGADFMISPGFSPALQAAIATARIPLVPGANTASDVQHARELGHLVQKFYPAWDHGHDRLEEFAAIYPDVSFLVTGNLDAGAVVPFARHRNVAALGGNWMAGSVAAAARLAGDRAAFRAARN
jgi:2-dehydro-3-deoxyphosphogluconate aldolase/(4S)-4-hydroxy-2-oxoglutarate aldolase